MKLRIVPLFAFVVVGIVALGLLLARPSHADTLHLDLPYGIGSVQLPWQSTEVVYGAMKPIKGGLWHQIGGASLPILTIGKLSSGERILDGGLGAVGAWPVQGDPVDFYGAFGHDIIQDIAQMPTIQALEKNLPFTLSSAHMNVGVSYSNALTGWVWGGTVSYAFGGSSTGAPASPPAQ